jgi:TatD DNase family protein
MVRESNMIVDAHCHLLGSHLGEQKLQSTLDRARAAGVGGFMAVGTDLEDSRQVLELAHRTPDIQACLGVHPHEAKTWEPSTAGALEALLNDPSARFVGETGLDWHYDFSPRDAQERVFREQIRLAKRLRKPLMIHTREAPLDTLRILEEEGADAVRGIIHCFSEDLAFARRALDLGFYLSFSGILTFKKAETIQEVAIWAPGDRILVETDSPYLAPAPHRGKTNEPAFVTHVAQRLAELRQTTLPKIAETTTRNLEALCGWAPSC